MARKASPAPRKKSTPNAKPEPGVVSGRAYWSGQLRLSLVSIPVELYPAVQSTAKIAFHQIHKPTGKRVRYEKVVPGVGPVEPRDILKGYEYEKGQYVLISDEEISEVRLETRRTLELVQFVDARELDPLYFEKPYYLVPQDELAEEAFRVVRDALRRTGKVGLGQIAVRGQEHLAAVQPCGTGLLLETLRYADELKTAKPYFAAIRSEEAPDELLKLAVELINRRTAPFDARAFANHYEQALRELIEMKKKAPDRLIAPPAEEKAPAEGKVIDIMAALRKSLESAGSGKPQRGKRGAA